MYTLRLILQGVIFLTTVNVSGKDYLWLLFLDPGYKTAIHHHAQLCIDESFLAGSNSPEGSAKCFDIAGDHLTLYSNKPLAPAVSFAQDTKPAKVAKPCLDCGSKFTFRQQKDDILWVNKFSEILKDVPLNNGYQLGDALKLREDILKDKYYKDGLILARMVVAAGEIRSYTLWGEKGGVSNIVPPKINLYTFIEPGRQCDPKKDKLTAVAEGVVIDIVADGSVVFSSRDLASAMLKPSRDIALKVSPSPLVEVALSSMRPDHQPRKGDFNAFYELLEHPEYFKYLPLPAPCVEGDLGGACSPARP